MSHVASSTELIELSPAQPYSTPTVSSNKYLLELESEMSGEYGTLILQTKAVDLSLPVPQEESLNTASESDSDDQDTTADSPLHITERRRDQNEIFAEWYCIGR